MNRILKIITSIKTFTIIWMSYWCCSILFSELDWFGKIVGCLIFLITLQIGIAVGKNVRKK